MTRLGETIKKARLGAKMTEKALAKKCGVAESFIKEVEAGRRIVSDDQAQRILKALGVKNPVSAELEVANEGEVKLRPKPRPYIIPVPQPEKKETPEETHAAGEAADAWLDALGGVVKRVPVIGEDNVVIDHVLTPVIGGKIEGGHPEKVLYYRCPDDSLRGFRIYAGYLLLTVPAKAVVSNAIMLIQRDGQRIARKITKMDGSRLNVQSFDVDFVSEILPAQDVYVLGLCVKLVRSL